MSGLILAVFSAFAADSVHADAAVGYGAGALLGTWPVPGVSGYVIGRIDLYPGFEAAGWRVGASVWGRRSVLPQPQAIEVEGDPAFGFDYLEYGVDVAIATANEGPWRGSGRFGMSRMDLDDWYDGVLSVPMFGVQGGVRRQLGPAFLELSLRGEWGSQRQAEIGDDGYAQGEDWWSVGAALSIGAGFQTGGG